MQNHLEISSKTQFWIRNMRNWTKTLTSVMSGPATASPGGQVLVSKAGFLSFSSSQITHFQSLLANSSFFIRSGVLLSKFIIFVKSIVLLNKFIIFVKSCVLLSKCTEDKSLSQNHVYIVLEFTHFIFLLTIL